MMHFIVYIFIFSVFLVPGIKITSDSPAIRIDEALVYVMLIALMFERKNMLGFSSGMKKYLLLLILLILWISVTMMGNNRLTYMSDYFEYYKMIKYIIILLFFYIFFLNFHQEEIFRSIRYVFCLVVIFNLCNYFDVAGFNDRIMPYYATEHHLSAFMESIEEGMEHKRMLGTMGSPNHNAVIMALFSIIFLAKLGHNSKNKKDIFFLVIALLMVIMSQSRTIFVGLAAVFFGYWLLLRGSIKYLIYLLILALFVFVLVALGPFEYISSLWTLNLAQNASWIQRLATWDLLIDMIKKSPWIGYGPNKAFFYQNELFVDNDYILMTWKYGFVGLVFYLLWILMPVYTAIKNRNLYSAGIIILFSVVVLTSALTSNPFNEPRIMVLYAMLCSIMYAECYKNKVNLLQEPQTLP